MSEPTKMDQVILSTLELLLGSAELLEDDEQLRVAQARQLTQCQHVLADADPIAGSGQVTLRPRARVALLTGLIDCLARVRRVAEERPGLHPALPALRQRHERLMWLREKWITQAVRGQPLRRPERDTPWFPPS